MLNKIILSLIVTADSSDLNPMKQDRFENPHKYTGWIYPIRYLLALRYLKQKRIVLNTFQKNKVYPIPVSEYKNALVEQLTPTKITNTRAKMPITAFAFKAKFIYPLLLALIGFGLFQVTTWYQQRQVENVLANHLPYFSDLLHRKLLLTHNDSNTELLKTVEASIASTKEKILADLPERNGIRDIIATQLAKLQNSAEDSETIMLGFKDVNTVFDQHKIPYYLSPKSFTMPCSSLIDAPVEQMMLLKKLESLMSNNNPELCRTTMMTTYKVHQRNELFYDNATTSVELPLFQVERIDKVPAVDSALGLTFKDRGIGSIILVDRIKNFARESILPALTFQGRSYVIPYWMQGYYEIEEAVTKGYKKDINDIYTDKTEQREVKATIKKLISNKFRMQNAKIEQTMQRTNSNSDRSIFGNGFDAISVLLGKEEKAPKKDPVKNKAFFENPLSKEHPLLDKLDKVLLPSIEHHEAYHQIDKKNWKAPSWLANTFEDKLSENGLDHTLEELGAYLSQLANTDQGQNIWLSKLLIFSLNPMTKGQAEYYASSIILTTMESIYLGKPVEPRYIATVEEKTQVYKELLTRNKQEISAIAKIAFEVLFERPMPKLRH